MTFAFVNQKGGVGKTTTCVTLGSFLVSRGKKVLVVDCDPQENATVFMGARKEKGKDLYHVLTEREAVEDCIVATAQTGLFCLPASENLAALDMEFASQPDRFFRLRLALSRIRSPFDFIFIDSPPSLGLLPVMALTCAQFAFIPLQGEYFSLEGLTRALKTIQHIQETSNSELELFGILLNMVDSRTLLARQVEQELREHFGEKVFEVVVPRLIKFAEAPGFEKPLYEFDRTSQASQIYEKLTDEFLKRLDSMGSASSAIL